MRSPVAASILLALSITACGGDDASDTAATSPTNSTSSSSGSSDSGDDPVVLTSASSSGADAPTGMADSSSDGGATTGGGGDPSYPAPDAGGLCPANTAPIALPGGSVCAPFCAGAQAPCPAAASGDAIAECTPFADDGGSGTPCTEQGDCTEGEACGTEGTCVAVAFWGCRLQCDGSTVCSDAMVCAGDACAYP